MNLFPQYADLGIARNWAGRIDVTPDVIPIIGPVNRIANFYIAAGFCGHGFALGPLVGKLIAELIIDGRSDIDLYPSSMRRFSKDSGVSTPEKLCIGRPE